MSEPHQRLTTQKLLDPRSELIEEARQLLQAQTARTANRFDDLTEYTSRRTELVRMAASSVLLVGTGWLIYSGIASSPGFRIEGHNAAALGSGVAVMLFAGLLIADSANSLLRRRPDIRSAQRSQDDRERERPANPSPTVDSIPARENTQSAAGAIVASRRSATATVTVLLCGVLLAALWSQISNRPSVLGLTSALVALSVIWLSSASYSLLLRRRIRRGEFGTSAHDVRVLAAFLHRIQKRGSRNTLPPARLVTSADLEDIRETVRSLVPSAAESV